MMHDSAIFGPHASPLSCHTHPHCCTPCASTIAPHVSPPSHPMHPHCCAPHATTITIPTSVTLAPFLLYISSTPPLPLLTLPTGHRLCGSQGTLQHHPAQLCEQRLGNCLAGNYKQPGCQRHCLRKHNWGTACLQTMCISPPSHLPRLC